MSSFYAGSELQGPCQMAQLFCGQRARRAKTRSTTVKENRPHGSIKHAETFQVRDLNLNAGIALPGRRDGSGVAAGIQTCATSGVRVESPSGTARASKIMALIGSSGFTPRVQFVDDLTAGLERVGHGSPWLFVALFLAGSLLLLWRLEALAGGGMEGTVLGTLVMPYCSGIGNLIFAFLLGRQGGNGGEVMTNCRSTT
jgi:hypothetical protein